MTNTDLSFVRNKRFRWLVLLALASIPLLGWWSYGLFDLDEGFYAAVTGSMIRHHEWITPLYNGHPWFEKPILIYWLAKPSVMLFGQDFGPRLPSVVATIATYGLVAWFVRRRVGPMAAVLSMFILGSSILVVSLGRMLMTDSVLLFFVTSALLTYWESRVSDRRWMIASGASLGFAVLAKGPVAIILFLLIIGWNTLCNRTSTTIERPRRPPLESPFVIGAVIFALIIASWYLPAYMANGHVFVQKFLIDQNIGRFTGGDQAHTLPLYKSFWFYIPVLLVGMFPWILWLPAAWPKRNSELGTLKAELKRFLAAWIAIIFVFFTISGAKLPHYILPCAPPIAILVAMYFADKWQQITRQEIRPKLFLALAWLLASWIVVQFGFEYWYQKSGQAEAHEFAKDIRRANNHDPVIAFELPRRNKDLGTGQAKIQETSLPSLSFYINQDLIETDSFEDLDVQPPDTWVFTRIDRVLIKDNGPTRLTTYTTGQYYQVLRRS